MDKLVAYSVLIFLLATMGGCQSGGIDCVKQGSIDSVTISENSAWPYVDNARMMGVEVEGVRISMADGHELRDYRRLIALRTTLLIENAELITDCLLNGMESDIYRKDVRLERDVDGVFIFMVYKDLVAVDSQISDEILESLIRNEFHELRINRNYENLVDGYLQGVVNYRIKSSRPPGKQE